MSIRCSKKSGKLAFVLILVSLSVVVEGCATGAPRILSPALGSATTGAVSATASASTAAGTAGATASKALTGPVPGALTPPAVSPAGDPKSAPSTPEVGNSKTEPGYLDQPVSKDNTEVISA